MTFLQTSPQSSEVALLSLLLYNIYYRFYHKNHVLKNVTHRHLCILHLAQVCMQFLLPFRVIGIHESQIPYSFLNIILLFYFVNTVNCAQCAVKEF